MRRNYHMKRICAAFLTILAGISTGIVLIPEPKTVSAAAEKTRSVGDGYSEAKEIPYASGSVDQLSDIERFEIGDIAVYAFEAGTDMEAVEESFRLYQDAVSSVSGLVLQANLNGAVSIYRADQLIAYIKVINRDNGDYNLLVMIPTGEEQKTEEDLEAVTEDCFLALENEDRYQTALELLQTADENRNPRSCYQEAMEGFLESGDYKDSEMLLEQARYDLACDYFYNREYDKAKVYLEESSPDYEDTAALLEICKDYLFPYELLYDQAMKVFEAGDPVTALSLLESLDKYERKNEAVSKILEACPYIETKPGDEITLGSYKNYPIKWQVLAKENGRLLLIAKHKIESLPYHEKRSRITWKKCTLRKWLNQDFLEQSFSGQERKLIQAVTVTNEANPVFDTPGGEDSRDRVFLLSLREAEQYFSSEEERIASPEHNLPKTWEENVDYEEIASSWLLRTPGVKENSVCMVTSFGWISGKGGFLQASAEEGGGGFYVDAPNGIRPAMWIDPNVPLIMNVG